MTMPATSTLFTPSLVNDLFSKVKGHSSLATLSGQTPVAFNGNKEFTFSMDAELDIVAEGGAKTHGGITLEPVTIVPIKFEYGARVSNEFMYATEEEQIAILQAFNDGFAKKVASGLDIAAMHGLNPRTGAASTVVGTNNFDSKVTQTVSYVAASIDSNIESAIALVEGSDGDITGLAMSTDARQALAALKNSANERLYPELAWGGQPNTINGLAVDVNRTVAKHASGADTDHVIVGDFANAFKWGYAKEIPLRVIEFGDPDNSGKDLAGHNEVYLRAEVFLGWGILNPASFARVKA